MHRGRTWTQRQLVGLGTPADYNERLLGLLERGATAVSLIPCNSVYRGYDMDSVEPELLGTCGVVVNNADHMDRCLDGVDVGEISCAMNDPSPFTLLAFMLVAAERRGIDWNADHRHVEPERLPLALRRQPHVLPALAAGRAARADGPHRLVPRSSCRAGTRCRSSASTCSRPARRRPRRWRSRSSSAVQNAEDCIARGMDPDEFLPRFTFFFDISLSFFEEIAKFRAGRRIWARHRARAARREGREVVALQVPRPDLGRRPDAPAAAQQHRARHGAGDGRHLRRPAVAAHRFVRRGLPGAERGRRAHRRRDAEHPARGSAPDRRHRSARRLVLRRVADRPRWRRRSSRS